MSSDLISAISARFVSGNSVPVERAHITVSEWEQIRQALAAHEAEQDQQDKDAALVAAVQNLLSVKGRFHTEQAYKRLADAYAALSTTKQEEL